MKARMEGTGGTTVRVTYPCGRVVTTDLKAVDPRTTPAEVARMVGTWNNRPAGRLSRCPAHGPRCKEGA